MKADRAPHVIQVQQAIEDELEQLVHWVQVRYRLGNRAARRFVGRRLNQRTLLTWRISVAKGRPDFPVGFRAGSKTNAKGL